MVPLSFLRVTGAFVAVNAALLLPFRAIYGAKRIPAKGSKGAKREGSRVADLLAYNTAALLFAVVVAVLGAREWLGDGAAAIGPSSYLRLYGHSEIFDLMADITGGYELYNTAAVIIFPEYCNAAFIGHHVTTFTLALLSKRPFLHYYGFFFFGFAMISNIPLAFIELTQAAAWPKAHTASRLLFALFFLALRTSYWPYVSSGFWADSLGAIGVTGAPTMDVPNPYALWFFLLANFGLTGLQLLWTQKIVKGVAIAAGLIKKPKRAD